MGRRNQSGVRSRSNRSITVDFHYRGIRCRETLKLTPTAANVRYATRFKAEIQNAIERGTFDYAAAFPNSKRLHLVSKVPGDSIVIEVALRDFLHEAEGRVARSTFIDWKNSVNKVLVPEFGHLKFTELRVMHVKAWIQGHDLTQKRTCNILTPLRQVMDQARANEIIEANPLADFKVTRRNVDKRRKLERDDVDPFDLGEINSALEELPPQAANYVTFAVWTGLRVEELIELKWTDVDLRNGAIRIRRARTRGQAKEPKTQAGRRTVKLLEPARIAIMNQKAHTAMFRGHIFHDPRTDAPYITDKQFREWQWRPALTRAGVRYRPPMQLRHTYATWMLGAGENIKWVSMQMGHESTKMTLDTYANWIPSMNQGAGQAAVDLIWSQVGHRVDSSS